MINSQNILLEQINPNLFSTKIDGLYFLQNKKYDDSRGYFREIAVIEDLEKQLGEKFATSQLNHSHSVKNVVRGMHIGSWNKLVTVISGVAFCAVIDVRPHSPTFLEKIEFKTGLGGDSLYGSFFLPKGLANSFCVVEGPVDYIYAVDKVFKERKENEDLAFSVYDPQFSIQWPIRNEEMIISDKDRKAPLYNEIKHLIS